jgi:hypothetical protein
VQSLRNGLAVPIQEEVRPTFDSKPRPSSWLPSFAGHGLPERMRTTIFAFMGLTAAAGLALVAIFAQLGFPLLSPAPLPAPSSERSAVGEGVPLEQGSGAVGPERVQGAAAASRNADREAQPKSLVRDEGRGGVDGSPVSVSAPDPDGGATAVQPEKTPAPRPTPVSSPAPVATPAPPAEPASAPQAVPASPKPDAKPASSKSSKAEVKAAKSKPDKPEAKTVKTKPAKSGRSEAKPAPEPAYEPAPSPPPTPVDDKGKGKGHQK